MRDSTPRRGRAQGRHHAWRLLLAARSNSTLPDGARHVLCKIALLLHWQRFKRTDELVGSRRAKPPRAGPKVLEQLGELPDPAGGFHLAPAAHHLVHQPHILECRTAVG